MSNRQQVVRKPASKASKAAAKKELDQGIAFTDKDGTRLQVRLGDVKGKHDAALVAATGMDFFALLQEMSKRQGLDLLAAAVWFGRLVNGRETGTYADLLDDFTYADVVDLDLDEADGSSGPPA